MNLDFLNSGNNYPWPIEICRVFFNIVVLPPLAIALIVVAMISLLGACRGIKTIWRGIARLD